MNTDYAWIGVFLIAMVILVIWLIRRNQKDKTELEEDLIQSDLKPEKHDEDDDINS